MKRRDLLRALVAAPAVIVAARVASVLPAPSPSLDLIRAAVAHARKHGIKPVHIGADWGNGQDSYVILVHPSTAERFDWERANLSMMHEFKFTAELSPWNVNT